MYLFLTAVFAFGQIPTSHILIYFTLWNHNPPTASKCRTVLVRVWESIGYIVQEKLCARKKEWLLAWTCICISMNRCRCVCVCLSVVHLAMATSPQTLSVSTNIWPLADLAWRHIHTHTQHASSDWLTQSILQLPTHLHTHFVTHLVSHRHTHTQARPALVLQANKFLQSVFQAPQVIDWSIVVRNRSVRPGLTKKRYYHIGKISGLAHSWFVPTRQTYSINYTYCLCCEW